MPDQVEDGGLSTAEAEKKVPEEEQTVEKPEVRVVSTQETAEQSCNAGTPETPMKSWGRAFCITVVGGMRQQ
jgi:hypothetical protein